MLTIGRLSEVAHLQSGDFRMLRLPSGDFPEVAPAVLRLLEAALAFERLPEAAHRLPSCDFQVAARLISGYFWKSCLQSCHFRKSHQHFGHFCKTNISCSSASWKKLGAHSNRKPHLSNCCALDHIIAPADPCSPSVSELHLRGGFPLATV